MRKIIPVTPEMQKLRDWLDANGIQWEDHSELSDGLIDSYVCRTWFTIRDNQWSVIHGYGTYGGFSSYGKDKGLLEVMCPEFDDVVGHCTAENAIDMIQGKGSSML